MKRDKLRPVLDGPWWLIGPNPDLAGKIDGDAEHRVGFERGQYREHNAPVDHHIFQDDKGIWHLWGCVRGTAVGRILYHWEADQLTQSPWRDTGELIRVDRSAGESVDDWLDQEWIQSPYFVQAEGKHYMFYGGHRSGIDALGNRHGLVEPDQFGSDPSLHQICLMTSKDGRDWVRHKNEDGSSRLFMSPGETRDPCVLNIEGLWHIYYAGYFDPEKPDEGPGFVVRTSEDLITWSDWSLVHRDPQYTSRNGRVTRGSAECPYVMYKNGYYYLFRTVDYYRCQTVVFRSEDPMDFGIGDASSKLVGRLPCGAPEFYEVDGQEYVSSSHAPLFGEMMCRLKWVPDDE